MTLRSTFAAALVAAALVPMAVALAVPLGRAERRAREETLERLKAAERQVGLLVERYAQDVEERAADALRDLLRSDSDLRSVERGPQVAARAVADDLARRHGLDRLTIGSGSGVLAESAVVERRDEISGPMPVSSTVEAELPAERLTLVGARGFGARVVAEIASITGGAVSLLDPEGRAVAAAGPRVDGPEATIPLDRFVPGWSLRIEVAPAEPSRVRRDALEAAAKIAPVAVVAALLVAVVLAQRISRPVRALAERADEVSRLRAGAAFEVLEERDEIGRLERAFERMLEALDASERSRLSAERVAAWREVARRIAHEVKNPLSPIRVAVENLLRTKERVPADLARAVEEEGEVILQEVESLRRLVDEFSAFARLPAPSFAPCDPRKLLRQAVARVAERAARHGVSVVEDLADAPEEIAADAEQLGRALRNVLDNALDAVEGSSRREVRVRLRRVLGRRGAMAEFEVADSGSGLDDEARRRIFEPYYTTKADRGGSGLGMAIVHRIVTEHGGEALAEGSPGRGTVITLRVPERAGTEAGR